MAYHFSANQYNDRYDPRKLGNWEYPKWHPERPRQRFQPTKIIADDNGRLLDGIKRENPWGNYVGTWDLPRKITREYVKQLTAPPEKLVSRWEKKKKQTAEAAELKTDLQQQPKEQSKEEPPNLQEVKEETGKKQQQQQQQQQQEEETCNWCNRPAKSCTCDRRSDSSVERCDDSLYCPKCHNELCLCENRCHCSNQD